MPVERIKIMIIESAFYNLPEILLAEQSREIVEYSLRNMFSLSLLLEFNARNIPYPVEHIKLERKYPHCNKVKCDLVVNLEAIADKIVNGRFGCCETNWVEIKYFGGIGRAAGTETKTENKGKILDDLLRLCLFPDELQGKNRKNGRYFICVFNRTPKEYLSYFSAADWVSEIFVQGIKKTKVYFNKLQPSTKKGIKSFHITNNTSLELTIDTKSFYPFSITEHDNFYGYLIKIIGYKITCDNISLSYSDFMEEPWDIAKIELHKQIIEKMKKI